MRFFHVLLALTLSLALSCGDDDTTTPGTDTGPRADAPGVDAPGTDTGGGPEVRAQILDYLRGDRAASLLVEIDAFPGAGIRPEAEGHFVRELGELLDKPGGVTVQMDEELPSHADTPWELDELRTLAAERFNLAAPADTTKLHVLYVDGRFRIEGVLGIALSGTSVVVFREVVEMVCDRAGALPTARASVCGAIEATVLMHETGHVIGLVNRGLPMVEDHEDAERPGHDETSGCLMYFALENATDFSGFLGGFLGDPQPIEFCAGSIADVRAQQD